MQSVTNGTASKLTISLFNDAPVTFKTAKNVNELSQLFCDQLNPSRTEAGYKPLSVQRLNFILQHLDLHDRRLFFASCLGAHNFSAFFWSRIRPQKLPITAVEEVAKKDA